MLDVETGAMMPFISVWAAANHVSAVMNCKHETAKKEIRRAIKNGKKRYGMFWCWKEDGGGERTERTECPGSPECPGERKR